MLGVEGFFIFNWPLTAGATFGTALFIFLVKEDRRLLLLCGVIPAVLLGEQYLMPNHIPNAIPYPYSVLLGVGALVALQLSYFFKRNKCALPALWLTGSFYWIALGLRLMETQTAALQSGWRSGPIDTAILQEQFFAYSSLFAISVLLAWAGFFVRRHVMKTSVFWLGCLQFWSLNLAVQAYLYFDFQLLFGGLPHRYADVQTQMEFWGRAGKGLLTTGVSLTLAIAFVILRARFTQARP
ncbi:hypothetical protein [Roseibium sediminis]|uniref:hypothetical protein n=1 Tax=Roseibium sediminis TaxID=1775174 RepID=UPI00123DA72F|nr:hypothetical protein [Roseibium sediminis]